MKNYRLEQAKADDLTAVCSIVQERIDWMDAVGIRQWNVTDYWGRYPVEYYAALIAKGEMYVLRTEDGTAVGVAAFFTEDERWPEETPGTAWYVHHLCTRVAEKGAGEVMLALTEQLARDVGKEYLRLDCADDNAFLNEYYTRLGFEARSHCVDRLYSGICREKKLI